MLSLSRTPSVHIISLFPFLRFSTSLLACVTLSIFFYIMCVLVRNTISVRYCTYRLRSVDRKVFFLSSYDAPVGQVSWIWSYLRDGKHIDKLVKGKKKMSIIRCLPLFLFIKCIHLFVCNPVRTCESGIFIIDARHIPAL